MRCGGERLAWLPGGFVKGAGMGLSDGVDMLPVLPSGVAVEEGVG